ncbi:hypothetical protein FRB99_006634 [Tulasnella sp. 403]|nr:hypothetical protein FRB99_006634 [Tulasnella sp. 403]
MTSKPEPEDLQERPKDRTAGNLKEDIPKALKVIMIYAEAEQLIDTIVEASKSLGAGIGALRYLNAGPRRAANWAMGTFVFVSLASWTMCRKERERELATMQTMIQHYPERHVKVAKERTMARKAQLEAEKTDGSG